MLRSLLPSINCPWLLDNPGWGQGRGRAGGHSYSPSSSQPWIGMGGAAGRGGGEPALFRHQDEATLQWRLSPYWASSPVLSWFSLSLILLWKHAFNNSFAQESPFQPLTQKKKKKNTCLGFFFSSEYVPVQNPVPTLLRPQKFTKTVMKSAPADFCIWL